MGSPMGFGAGQPSPFYLQALPSPLGGTPGGGQNGIPSAGLTNSAYALLNSFFSPQRTTAPPMPSVNEGDEGEEEENSKASKGTERTRKRSALATSSADARGGSSSAAANEDDDAAGTPPAKLPRRNTQPKLELDAGAPAAGDNTRLANRRFSSGTPLASPGRLSRGASKEMLFSYDKVNTKREAARVTSSVESTDATPLV